MASFRRPAKLSSKLILSPSLSPARKDHQFRRSVTLKIGGEDTICQVGVRALALKDCGLVYNLGEAVFTKVGVALSRTWDEYEVVNSYSAYFPYCAVAEIQFVDGNHTKPRVVGFVLGCPIFKKNETMGMVSWIAVDVDCQRRGIGSMLLKWYEAIVSDEMVSKIFVDTPDDFRALRFFEKHGFKNPIFETFLSLNIEDIPISATSKTDLIKFGTGIKIEGNGEGKETETKKTEKEIIEKEKEEEKEKETKEEAGRVIVREMGVTDFYEVLKLGNEVFHDDVFWDEGEIVDMFQTDAECCLVAEKDSRIVGFTLGSTAQKKELGIKKKVTYGYLVWLGVAPDMQRQRVGASLYNQFIEVMKECEVKAVLVDTLPSNLAAGGFFKKMGFRHVATHVFMEKTLMEML